MKKDLNNNISVMHILNSYFFPLKDKLYFITSAHYLDFLASISLTVPRGLLTVYLLLLLAK